MAKPTVKELKTKANELLALQAAHERYEALEKEIKADMATLKYKEVIVELGRVFISTSDQVVVSPELAIQVLGEAMAGKVIVVKKSVSNDILRAFGKAGEINEADLNRLFELAEHKPIVKLHVRPLM